MTNDLLWAKTLEENKPIIREPESCDATCIRFKHCSYPANCRVRVKQARREKQERGER